MKRRTFVKALPAATILGATAFAQETSALQPIALPKPQADGGKSVLASLWERKSNRSVSEKELPPQVLSNLLWAAFGVNRVNGPSGKPGRTAPSAMNSQEIDLYVAMAKGVYLYEAVPHRLNPVVAGDFRRMAGGRSSAKAPVRIFFAVDLKRYSRKGKPDQPIEPTEAQKSYYNCAVGLISQNIYLLAASQGLATCLHTCDTTNTPKAFRLSPDQRILFAQTVGYPA